MSRKKKINKTVIINKTKKKSKKSIEFSKKLLLMLFIQQSVFLMIACALMFVTQTTDALTALTAEVFGQTAIAIGFYYWKAKAENVLKIKKEAKKADIVITEDELTNESDEA